MYLIFITHVTNPISSFLPFFLFPFFFFFLSFFEAGSHGVQGNLRCTVSEDSLEPLNLPASLFCTVKLQAYTAMFSFAVVLWN